MIGKTLRRRYQIIQLLGSGGFGVTYLALDHDLPGSPKRVVKHLKPKDPNPAVLPVARRLFEDEAKALYHLKHPQIPELFAHFEEDGEFYLVQDYIDGDDLSKAELTPGKKLSETEVIKLLQGILEVLAFVHQQNTIHRDIKPQNLIRCRLDGKIFLIDFGAVKEINTLVINTQGQTIATIVIGTDGYMPSEQANRHPQLCSDVYAVGMVGIQALTGIHPSQLPTDPNTLEVIWRNQASVSPKLAAILDKMVRYHFSQRYPSAVSALQALEGLTIPTLSLRRLALFMGLFGGLVSVLVGVRNLLHPPFEPQPTPTGEVVNIFSIYENPNYGIKIKYPQSWDKQENPPNPFTNQVVEFISPETESEPFREKLIITVEKLSHPQSLEEYTNSAKTEILQQNTNAKITNEGDSVMAGKSAYRVVYTVRDDKHNFKKMEVWTLKNYKAYSITYEAEADKYDKYLNSAESMIKSLQVDTK